MRLRNVLILLTATIVLTFTLTWNLVVHTAKIYAAENSYILEDFAGFTWRFQ